MAKLFFALYLSFQRNYLMERTEWHKKNLIGQNKTNFENKNKKNENYKAKSISLWLTGGRMFLKTLKNFIKKFNYTQTIQKF